MYQRQNIDVISSFSFDTCEIFGIHIKFQLYLLLSISSITNLLSNERFTPLQS